MSLWVPPKVDKALREERNAYTASVESMIQRFHGIMREFNPLLAEIDPHLELIFVPPHANVDDVPGLIAGRYMVMRHNPGAPPSLMVVEDEEGRFMEPTSRLLDDMRERDMWSPQAVRERDQRRARREYEAQKQREREQAERHAELEERWAAATRAFVSMDRSQRWTQNAAGRRGARAA